MFSGFLSRRKYKQDNKQQRCLTSIFVYQLKKIILNDTNNIFVWVKKITWCPYKKFQWIELNLSSKISFFYYRVKIFYLAGIENVNEVTHFLMSKPTWRNSSWVLQPTKASKFWKDWTLARLSGSQQNSWICSTFLASKLSSILNLKTSWALPTLPVKAIL